MRLRSSWNAAAESSCGSTLWREGDGVTQRWCQKPNGAEFSLSHAAKSASNFIVQMCPSCAWVVVPDVYFQLFSGGTFFCLHCLNNLYCVTCIAMSNESLAHWINNHWYIMKGFNLQPLSFGPYAKISRKRAVIVWKPKRLQLWSEMEKQLMFLQLETAMWL